MSHPLTAFINGLPKAELHLHLEGSLEPELMFELAGRNKMSIPFKSVEEVRAAYSFSNLQDFLDIYYQGAGVLQTESDFYDLTMAYLRRAHADAVRHVEVFYDPQTHTERGQPFAVAINGILAALRDGQQQFGISSGLILCILRHLSEEAGLETLQQAEPWYDRLLGVGLDSSELGHPPSKFQRLYERVGQIGLKRVAHAGEEGPAAYVREALDLLHIDRLDHGNRSMDDAELVQRLVREQMTLTVCPLSNHKLCVVPDLTQHPLRRMLQAGLHATVNSDDPAYFGGYVNANFHAITAALDLSRAELLTLARNSFSGSFLSPASIQTHLADIERYAATAH
jgi:adenosine deaminase